MLKVYEKTTPSEEQHIKNIQILKDFSKNVEIKQKNVTVIMKNKLNIGTVQKLFNLLCKYHWCAGWIQEPPHLLIDRDMLGAIKSRTVWTHLDSIDEYKKLISKFKEKSKKDPSGSLAQWELKEWSDRREYTGKPLKKNCRRAYVFVSPAQPVPIPGILYVS